MEIELAFILGRTLKGPGVGLAEVLRATEYVVPAIEIVDARLQDPRKIFDTVADNGAAAGIVVGGRPVGPLDVDLRWVGGIMKEMSKKFLDLGAQVYVDKAEAVKEGNKAL